MLKRKVNNGQHSAENAEGFLLQVIRLEIRHIAYIKLTDVFQFVQS
jgi:hypothetical protein